MTAAPVGAEGSGPSLRRPTVRAVRDARVALRLEAGTVLESKYVVEAPIAEGGGGRVYRARHRTLGSPVAVKFVIAAPGARTATERLEQFLAEARTAASVRHPNVVTIVDFGSHEGEPFMVMELLEGLSLDERMLAGTIPVEHAVDIVAQLLAGLDAVHRAGIVHGDVKPGNVFLTPSEEGYFVRLLDFGVSRSVHGAEANELVVGTPEYMAPEQALGMPLDPRADLYSTAVVLYELLSGNVPFDDPDPQVVVERVAFEAPPSLGAHRPDLPRLVDVVDHAMRLDPGDRFLSAREMRLVLLGRTSLEMSGRVSLPGLVAAPIEPARRTPDTAASARASRTTLGTRRESAAALWGSAALFVTLGIGLAGWWLHAHEAEQSTSDARESEATPNPLDVAASPTTPTPAAAAPTPALVETPGETPTVTEREAPDASVRSARTGQSSSGQSSSGQSSSGQSSSGHSSAGRSSSVGASTDETVRPPPDRDGLVRDLDF